MAHIPYHDTSGSLPVREIIMPALTQVQLMERSRNQATFDSNKLTEVIFGGQVYSKDAVDRQKEAFARVEKALNTDLSKLPARYGNMNREQMMDEGMRTGSIAVNDGLDHKHSFFDQSNLQWSLANSNPFSLTGLLFTPLLRLQCSAEQLAYWLPLAESGRIIGSFAQTELGHGTFVGGLQTTATFDKETGEFVIHTPSISATKYWPGALGFAATHAIVVARMIIAGTDHGVHSFVMQIRSLEDFKPLPGIELGDIGLKMSYNDTDNGYAVFKHVRIPRKHLLMRYTTVTRDGSYSSDPLSEKLLYGGLLNGRTVIIRNCAFQLAQALTIATRYSVVRQQGEKKDHGLHQPEIMSYKLQHHRLLTLVSMAYANIFASKTISASYQQMLEQQASGRNDSLPYMHMIIAGLKAWSTQTASDGAEDARKMCGGHGYLMMSGLPEIVASCTATCTFEGENVVMWKQVSRYLMKGMAAPSLPHDMVYMASYSGPVVFPYQGDDFLRPEVLVEIFEHRSARLTHEAYEALCNEQGSRASAENTHAVALHIAARACIDLFVLQSFISSIAVTLPSTLHAVLTRLLLLYALTTISSPLSLSSATFALSSPQIASMRAQTNTVLEELLPDAIALTDAWNFTDASLSSALGCRDGDVYRRIMEWTRQLPINVHAAENGGVLKGPWEASVKPFLREGVVRSRGMSRL
ncbi:Peroxisomal acyl-coenzyme A oxidase [Lachnellula suecica]|uniref:Acyl-coenzyme A oxidase n=1 Tax=Lachnellula suecica TaxID=602035 RepID=A0A8T9CEB9_9HELO|nr:Peroxisomal acyl-coenzyme A oxidase [Lachnellula suecica]